MSIRDDNRSEMMAPRMRVGWLVVLAIAGAFAVFCRCTQLNQPFLNDAGLYIAMGKTLVSGGQLYVDLWDTKLPSVAFLTAPLFAAFGNHWWPYVAVQAAMGLAIPIMCFFIARRITGLVSAGYAAATYGLIVANGSLFAASGFQLETPLAFFAVTAAVLIVRVLEPSTRERSSLRRTAVLMLAAGVLAGIAAMAKPTGLAVLAAAGLAMLALIRRLGVDHCLVAIAAMIVGVTLVLLPNLAAIHHLGIDARLPDVVREINAYASGTPWSQVFSLKTAIFVIAAALPMGMIVAFALLRRIRMPELVNYRRPLPQPATLFIGLWLAIEFVGVLLQKRVYGYHFLPPMVPAAIAFAILSSRLEPRLLRPAIVGIAVLPVVLLTFAIRREIIPPWRSSDAREIAAAIRQSTSPGEAIFADNIGTQLLLADRPPGGRLGMLIHLINDDNAPQRFMDQLLGELEMRKPSLMILPIDVQGRIRDWESQPILASNASRREAHRQAWNRLVGYTRSHYVVDKDIASVRIYRRNPDRPMSSVADQ